MNAVCITRNSTYACWPSRGFSDQCEDLRLDDGPVAFWSDTSFIMRFAILRGLTGTQVSCCSTNDFMLAKVLGSLWHGPSPMSRIFDAVHCIYFHFTGNMCKVCGYLLYLMICCDNAKHLIPVNVYFITVLGTRVPCFRIRGRQSYYCARNTTRLVQVACAKQHSGSLRVHEADRERCFEIFSKAVRRITN